MTGGVRPRKNELWLANQKTNRRKEKVQISKRVEKMKLNIYPT
jgi:hypothetical protein